MTLLQSLIAIHGYIVGAGLTYWLMQQKINKLQKLHSNQMRELREELERNHELRMQETIKSLQKDYQAQLNKETHQLAKAHETQLQETLKSFETQSQRTNELTTEEIITPKQELLSTIIEEVLTETTQEIPEIATASTSSLQLGETETASTSTPQLVETETASTSTPQLVETEQVLLTTDTVIENYSETTIQVIEEKVIFEVNQIAPEKASAELAVTSEVSESAGDINKTTAIKNTQNDQGLEQKILTWKNSKQVSFLPQLIQYSNNSDSNIRSLVASAIGEIAAFRRPGLEIQRAVPVLGKLSQDPMPLVRKSAIESLSNIQSEKVIPFLQKALRDSDSDVVKLANKAMNKYKAYRVVNTKKLTTVLVKKQKY